MYTLYGDALSGNCYKVQLLMALLDMEYHWVAVDILAGDTQTSTFKQLNVNQKIPVLALNDQQTLAESNAILNYLAEGSIYLPDNPLDRAKVLQWQFFEQYSHEPFIAVARYINKYLGLPDDKKEEYQSKQVGGYKALAVMDEALSHSPFLVGKTLTIADISLYAYTHVAHEGGFDLSAYSHINEWMQRIESQARYQVLPIIP